MDLLVMHLSGSRRVDHRFGVRGKHMKSDRPCRRAVGFGPSRQRIGDCFQTISLLRTLETA